MLSLSFTYKKREARKFWLLNILIRIDVVDWRESNKLLWLSIAHLSASLTMKIESTAASTEMTASVWAVPARFCFCGHCLHNYTTLLAMPHCSLQIFKRSKYSRNIINVSPIPSLRFLSSQLFKWSHCHLDVIVKKLTNYWIFWFVVKVRSMFSLRPTEWHCAVCMLAPAGQAHHAAAHSVGRTDLPWLSVCKQTMPMRNSSKVGGRVGAR